MNSFKTNTLSKAFCLVAAIGMLMASCSKNDSDVADVDCLAHLNPDTLRFVVLDKESGADLFFSDSPVYDTTELKLFRKGAGRALEPAHQGIAENRGNIHFFSYVYPADTLFMQIADQPLDTIAFTGQVAYRPCPQSLLVAVTFNSEAPQKEAHGRIVPLYRKE
jgi:hypothetical protein